MAEADHADHRRLMASGFPPGSTNRWLRVEVPEETGAVGERQRRMSSWRRRWLREGGEVTGVLFLVSDRGGRRLWSISYVIVFFFLFKKKE